MPADGDFEVEVLIYNRHITECMCKNGLSSKGRASIPKLMDKMGYGFQSMHVQKHGKANHVRDLLRMKSRPTEEDDTWKAIAIEIAETLGVSPDELWPGELKHRIPASTNRIFVANVGEETHWLIMSSSQK